MSGQQLDITEVGQMIRAAIKAAIAAIPELDITEVGQMIEAAIAAIPAPVTPPPVVIPANLMALTLVAHPNAAIGPTFAKQSATKLAGNAFTVVAVTVMCDMSNASTQADFRLDGTSMLTGVISPVTAGTVYVGSLATTAIADGAEIQLYYIGPRYNTVTMVVWLEVAS